VSKRKARSKAPADIRDPAKQRPPLPIPSILQILVECESERRQQDLFERLQQEGYSCRVLTL
jgi:hypothetical protein